MFFPLWFPAYSVLLTTSKLFVSVRAGMLFVIHVLNSAQGGNGRQRHSLPTSHPLSLERSLEEPTDKLSQRNEQ